MVDFNRQPPTRGSAAYHAVLRSYDFCLSVTGASFDPRISDYVASGCIPVIVRPGGVLWPLESAGLKLEPD